MKKPSERIEEIRLELIAKDWVAFGGNSYSRETWFDKCDDDIAYHLKAILNYLDEEADAGHSVT